MLHKFGMFDDARSVVGAGDAAIPGALAGSGHLRRLAGRQQMDTQQRTFRGDREVPRHIYDEVSGEHWTVREVDTTAVPGARAARCLICDSGSIARRLWNYPRDWGALPPSALLRLIR